MISDGLIENVSKRVVLFGTAYFIDDVECWIESNVYIARFEDESRRFVGECSLSDVVLPSFPVKYSFPVCESRTVDYFAGKIVLEIHLHTVVFISVVYGNTIRFAASGE